MDIYEFRISMIQRCEGIEGVALRYCGHMGTENHLITNLSASQFTNSRLMRIFGFNLWLPKNLIILDPQLRFQASSPNVAQSPMAKTR